MTEKLASSRSDVFISYNHSASKPLVLEMKKGLDAAGLEVWLDAEDIPKGVDYKAEFLEGVEGADTVIIMMNNAYIQSENCKKEMNKTHELKKRVILILDDADFDQWHELPEYISNINAIRFHGEAGKPFDQDKAMQELVSTIKTIPGYAKLHTRYLVSARQWREKGHDISELLQGAALKEAENWRDSEVEVPPTPTAEQKQYIHISRIIQDQRDKDQVEKDKKLARRQRDFMLLLYGGMIAFIGYFIWITTNMEENNQLQNSQVFNSIGAIATEIIIDLDALATLSQAVVEDDDRMIATLLDDHIAELDSLRSLFPFMNIYSLTPDLDLIAAFEESAIPEEAYVKEFIEAQAFFSENESDDFVPTTSYLRETGTETVEAGWYNIGYIYIVNQNDEDELLAILALESPDRLGIAIGNIETLGGTFILIIVVSVIFVAVGFFRRNFFGKKEEETLSDKENYQNMVKEELEARTTKSE